MSAGRARGVDKSHKCSGDMGWGRPAFSGRHRSLQHGEQTGLSYNDRWRVQSRAEALRGGRPARKGAPALKEPFKVQRTKGRGGSGNAAGRAPGFNLPPQSPELYAGLLRSRVQAGLGCSPLQWFRVYRGWIGLKVMALQRRAMPSPVVSSNSCPFLLTLPCPNWEP